MKKSIAILLVMIIGVSLILSGCGPSKAELASRRDQEAFDTAKEAYTSLCEAADMTVSVMSSVYGAWYFGIYKADDSSSSNVVANLAKEVALSQSELDAGVKSLATTLSVDESTLKYAMYKGTGDTKAWQYCLFVVNESYVVNGNFGDIQSKIDTANAALKTMTNEFDDYKHYPTLKEFYAKVSSYAEFSQNPSGSFQQLKDTINDYENSIRTYRSDLSFVFE